MLKTVSSVINAIGALNYKGTWNAATNTPTLTSGVGTKGDYYVVSVAGSTNLDGITTWGVGDWAVFNGTVWQKADGGSTADVTTLTVTSLTGYMYANNTSPVTASLTIPNAGLANSTATLGNTTVALGSTTTSVGNLTLNNVNVASGNSTVTTDNIGYANISTALRTQPLTGYLYGNANTGNVTAATTIPNSGLANSTATLGNTTITLGSTTTSVGNLTLTNVTISSGTWSSTTQPAFNAYLSTNQANVTGDGTNYTVIFDTEVFDQGSNYNNATGVFTAPVAGKYQFNVTINFLAGAATGGFISLVTTGRTYRLVAVKPSNVGTAGGDTELSGSALVSLAANDTVSILVSASGTTKTVAVYGTATTTSVTHFSGFLAC